MAEFGWNFEKLEKDGKFRFLDMITVKEKGVASVLERIVEEVGNFKAKRLVIDSFSAMAQAFKKPIDARIILHTLLGRIIRQFGCTTILIAETPIGQEGVGLGVEEFVADNVVRLKFIELEGYTLRELELLKLRGTRIKERKLIYTLEGGFNVIPPFKFKPVEKPDRFQPIPDPPNKYSTDVKTLDEALDGGLPKGSAMLLEIDEKISASMYHLLVAPMAANFVLQGRGLFIVPSMGVNPLLFHKHIGAYGGTEEEWRRYIRIIMKGSRPSESFPSIILVKGKDWREDLGEVFRIGKELATKTGQPNLFIVGVDALTTFYGEKQCEEILNISATEARRTEAAIIAIVKAGYRSLAIRLSSIVDVYLRLKREHGCLLLYGVKPRMGIYAVECDVSKGYPIPKLTPIV